MSGHTFGFCFKKKNLSFTITNSTISKHTPTHKQDFPFSLYCLSVNLLSYYPGQPSLRVIKDRLASYLLPIPHEHFCTVAHSTVHQLTVVIFYSCKGFIILAKNAKAEAAGTQNSSKSAVYKRVDI